MSKSIAEGAKLTPETFADFVQRLSYHNRGEGVKQHITADPIFMVQQQATVFGLDDDYSEGKVVAFEDSTWYSPEEYWNDAEEELEEELNRLSQEAWGMDFMECEEDEQWLVLADLEGHTVTGYRHEWQNLNAHLTREAAEAFIRRKQHDYPPLRVFVESMYFGWEYREIIAALIDGRLVLADSKGGAA